MRLLCDSPARRRSNAEREVFREAEHRYASRRTSIENIDRRNVERHQLQSGFWQQIEKFERWSGMLRPRICCRYYDGRIEIESAKLAGRITAPTMLL